jgi:hypothetical protein
MPFDAGAIAALETALCDGFDYHRAMNAFVVRAGVSKGVLDAARQRADEAARQSARAWSTAPKRYVAQELLTELNSQGEAGDRLLANLITAVLKHSFKGAPANVLEAVADLRTRIETDKLERKERDDQRRQELELRNREVDREKERASEARQAVRDTLRNRFFELIEEPNHQQRGYALERFLNDFLDFEGLDPRKSFKLVGEQIDGSFAWKGRTYLTEAKWVKEPVAGAEFGAFIYKIAGKTADTRGLYISVNGYSQAALDGLKGKGSLRFICIDGAHIVRALSAGQSFADVLNVLWRCADETGEAYLPVSEMHSAQSNPR